MFKSPVPSINAQTEPNQITQAQFQIDSELAYDPEKRGIELAEGLRLIIKSPFKTFFEISDQDRLVRVTSVGWE